MRGRSRRSSSALHPQALLMLSRSDLTSRVDRRGSRMDISIRRSKDLHDNGTGAWNDNESELTNWVFNQQRSRPSLMAEFAIGMTVLFIAAPLVLVGGT